jgi:hypothetical protein
MNGVGRAAVAGAMAVLFGVREAQGTVSTTLVADAYLVTDGAKTYSVLDIYAQGNNVGDCCTNSVLGAGTHAVVFATSQATGTNLIRDSAGRITAGSITRDIFVQSDNSGWIPTNADGKPWDSFFALGVRTLGAKVINRAGVMKDRGLQSSWTAASGFTQMLVPNSNFIDNGTTSGVYTGLGSNYSTAGASEDPFGRVNLYSSYWDSTYPDLPRPTGYNTSKGAMQNGAATAGLAAIGNGSAGTSLNFCWMIGRFAIDVTGKSASERITMNAQFNMVGKNGTGAESGTTFTGATTASYKVSQFFAFAMPLPCPSDLDDNRVVDTADIGVMLLDFGDCQNCASDLDGNGLVDTADVSLLLLDFGSCP